ncbi:MAG: extracellular solute-binding protein, partial [Chloroflexota bacterium]|nr:extracellular solute-binding protein [Chloroflexota bacterium]
LDRASADPTYGADFNSRVQANVVSREDNVRQVVAKVQLGEADAGVVYATDLTPRVRDQVDQLALPEELQTIASYWIAVARGNNSAGGQAFVDYVLSPAGQRALASWGFIS